MVVERPGGAVGEQAGGVDLRQHVREVPLDSLEIQDLAVEGGAPGGEGEGTVEGGPRDPQADGRGHGAGIVQRGHRLPHALALRSDQVVGRHRHAVEDQVDVRAVAQAEGGGVRPLLGGDARHAAADEEDRHTGRRLRQNDVGFRRRAGGDEGFPPAQDPAVALAHRLGVQAADVAAVVRLGQRVGGDQALAELRQDGPLQAVRAEQPDDGLGLEDGDQADADGGAGVGRLLEQSRAMGEAQPPAAGLDRQGQAVVAVPRQRLDRRHGIDVLAVDGVGLRLDMLGQDAPQRFEEFGFDLVDPQRHGFVLSSPLRPSAEGGRPHGSAPDRLEGGLLRLRLTCPHTAI